MKRTFKYALSAILTAAIVMPALATDNFPDVPDNHWAFEALQRLKKDGLLVGYPDGLFRGNRPASRYELAVAIHAAYTNLKSVTDGLDSQIKALSDKLNGGVASTADVQNLRDALTALQNDVNGMKSYGDDIAQLKKLSEKFESELTKLGIDVTALQKDLGDLSDRVKKLENKKPTVNISGDVNLLMLGGNSREGNFGLDTSGHLNGVDPVSKGPAGIINDLQTMEEGAFTFAGTNTEGPKWKGTLVIGNMLDTFGGQGTLHEGIGYTEGNSDVYLQDFSVKFDSSIVGLNFNAELGRVGYKVSPYIFQRVDTTPYFSNDRWDDGLYRFDGGIVGFSLGSTKIDVFAGNNDKITSTGGVNLNPVVSGPINGQFQGVGALGIDRTLGVKLSSPLTSNGNLNLAYLWLDSENPVTIGANGPTTNRLAVYGGDLNFTFGKVAVSGGYAKSDLQENTTNVNNQDNTAWHAEAKYDISSKFGINGGYREIQANYLAPGDWGRLGIDRNPTNIKGWQVGAHYDITPAWTLSAGGEFDKGYSDAFGPTSGFDTGTDINEFNVNLTWHVNTNLNLLLGYEDTEFTGLDPAVTANATNNVSNASYKWTTFGIGYGLSETSKLTLQYQVSDISNDFQAVKGGGARFTGGLLSGQLSIKF
jgi:hypothetical protein